MDVEISEEYFELLPATAKTLLEQNEHLNLDKCLIEYILNLDMTLFPESLSTWTDFAGSNNYNFENFAFLSTTELRNIFVYAVLPKIFDYSLTDSEKEMFDALDCNPQYMKTARGFERLTKKDRRSPYEPQRNVDYIVNEQEDTVPSQQNDEITSSIACVVLSTDEAEQVYQRHKFPLNQCSHAWLSAVLSTDWELATCRLLPSSGIKKRLNESYDRYEKTARLPENFVPIEELRKRLMKFNKVLKRMTSLIDEKYL